MIWQKISAFQLDERLAFILETLSVFCVVLFVAAARQNPISIFAPLLFSIIVLIFAAERGPISKLLKLSPFLFLGALSYSIYMVHWPIETLLLQSIKSLSTSYQLELVSSFRPENETVDMLGATQLQGDIWLIILFVLVVSVSAITYRYIEVPSRLWFRKQAQVERP